MEQITGFTQVCAKALLCKEVIVLQPWWKISPPKTEVRVSYTKLAVAAFLVGGVAVARKFARRVGRPPIKVDPMCVAPEGLVPGSALMEGGRLPACQVQVLVERSGVQYIVGSGIRIENYLVTPAHNFHSGMKSFISNGDKVIPITSVELHLAPDLVAYELSEKDWSQLMVSKAKLAPLNRSANVSITSACDSKYSISELKVGDLLGRCIYTGSTMPGFSGAAYMNGNSCVGMHQHGGAYGGGYEALYMYQRLKLALRRPDEDSAEFFMNEYKHYTPRYEELEDNAVVVRSQEGHYHLTTKDMMDRLKHLRERQSDDWAEMMEQEELEREVGYEPESMPHGHQGEVSRSVSGVSGRQQLNAPKASRSNERVSGSPSTAQPMAKRAYSELSLSQLKKLAMKRKLQRQLVDMEQQTPRPPPSGSLSITNSQKLLKGVQPLTSQQ